MSKLSDPNVVPELINQTWTLYQQTQDPAKKAQLAGQLQQLSLHLGNLADKIPDQTKQEYKDAVTAVQSATQTVKQAQADEAKIAAAIGQIAQVTRHWRRWLQLPPRPSAMIRPMNCLRSGRNYCRR